MRQSSSNPIGILDSGVGGIGIFKKVAETLPFEDIVYFADSVRAPYGSKKASEIQSIIKSIVSYLIDKYAIKALVVACNTATVSSIDYLRSSFKSLPIVGVVPVIKPASIKSKTKEILCLATDITLQSKAQQELVKSFADNNSVVVHSVPCNGIVELIEQGLSTSQKLQDSLRYYISPFKDSNIDTVVLGCTHYTLIEEVIRQVIDDLSLKGVCIMDSNEAIARQLKRVLIDSERLAIEKTKGVHSFVVNGVASHFASVASRFIGKGLNISLYKNSS